MVTDMVVDKVADMVAVMVADMMISMWSTLPLKYKFLFLFIFNSAINFTFIFFSSTIFDRRIFSVSDQQQEANLANLFRWNRILKMIIPQGRFSMKGLSMKTRKNQTNATNVIMHLLTQAILGDI